jgi:collagenase-like PrtC family protease
VCSKRHEVRLEDWLAIGRKLAAAGKQVVLSTCELIESESDLRVLRKITANGEFLVEANDLGAVRLLAGRGPFVAGPYLNIYSRATLEFFRSLGAMRWVMPVEMSRSGLAEVLRPGGLDLETEVFCHGRLPLAVSARCFTARYNNQSKDDCGFRCVEHPDGLVVNTQDGEAFLAMNGLQTQSARFQDLGSEVPSLVALGVSRARISPHSTHTGEVARIFHGLARGELSREEGRAALDAVHPLACDGYWHGRPGLERSGGA